MVVRLIVRICLVWIGVSGTLNPFLEEFVSKNNYFGRVYKWTTCNDSQPAFMNYSNLRMTGSRNKITAFGLVDIKETIVAPIKYKIEVSYRSIKTGVWHHANPVEIPDICIYMNNHLMKFIKVMEPPITECPVKEGLYKLNTLDINIRPWGFLASNDNYYRIKVTGQKDEKKSCLYVEGTIKVIGKTPTRRTT